jgi:hypothetical protein
VPGKLGAKWRPVYLIIDCFVYVKSRLSYALSWVDNHNHTRLAMLGLGAVDGHGLSVLDRDSEARQGAGTRKEDVVLATNHFLSWLLGGCRGCRFRRSGARSRNKARVKLAAWSATLIGISSRDGVVLCLLEWMHSMWRTPHT